MRRQKPFSDPHPFARCGLALLALCLAAPAAADASDPVVLLQLVDYVGVDYPEAVADGRIVNAAEYAEMEQFAARIVDGVAALPATEAAPALVAHAADLSRRIASKAAPAEIGSLTRELRDLLMRHHEVVLAPKRAPDLVRGAELYAENCAACHGGAGRGDGPAAEGLEPAPTDFTDGVRARQRSLYGLYNTITLGVDGTSMASFDSLSDDERWALAFHVGGLFADRVQVARGERAWKSGALGLQDAVTRSPAELEALAAEGSSLSAWVRSRPAVLFEGRPEPVEVALARIGESVGAYRDGRRQQAFDLAVAAYLEGFELIEPGLQSVRPKLVREVEDTMLDFRTAIGAGAPVDEIEDRAAGLDALLGEAASVLRAGSLPPGAAFSSALVILLREGLEAILVLGAMIAILLKTGRREGLAYVHAGWIGALAAGVAVWAASVWLIDVSGMAREVSEGVIALFAAGILFYAGFWMHSRTNAQRWSRYIQDKVHGALRARTLWALAGVAFFAVFREVLETMLFYQALWVQVAADARQAFAGGVLVAAGILAALAWGIFRFGLRIPLKQFFTASAAVMFGLAVVFAGKGILALQEAGKLPLHRIPLPRIDALGIYPSLQSVSLQLMLVLAAVTLVLRNHWRARRAAATTS